MTDKANRYKHIDDTKEQFINARITTPQTYDEIKEKGQVKILKIASSAIVEKLLKRCEYYKGIIGQKTQIIKSKNELIGLLAGRLQGHEPELFKTDFKEIAEAVEQAQQEKVETGIEKGQQELTEEDKKEVEKDNDDLDKDDEEEPDIDPDPDKEKCSNCGETIEEGSDHDCPDIDDDDIIECGGDGPDNDDLEDDPEPIDNEDKDTEGNIEE